jgi:hypothetical protein
MVDAVMSILNPDQTIWQNLAITIDAAQTFDDARMRLMDEFIRRNVGSLFARITPNDAWHFWQMAEGNGYRLQTISIAAARTEISAAAA